MPDSRCDESGTPIPPGAIGADVWPGASKLLEECGELVQVLGKLAAYPEGPHPDGTDLRDRLFDELADVAAAVAFFADVNDIFHDPRYRRRIDAKVDRFWTWHREAIS